MATSKQRLTTAHAGERRTVSTRATKAPPQSKDRVGPSHPAPLLKLSGTKRAPRRGRTPNRESAGVLYLSRLIPERASAVVPPAQKTKFHGPVSFALLLLVSILRLMDGKSSNHDCFYSLCRHWRKKCKTGPLKRGKSLRARFRSECSSGSLS